MSKVIFNNGEEANITSAYKTNNLIKLIGENIPQNTNGFVLIRDFSSKRLNYSDFSTIYRIEDDGVTYSNDGSVYSESHTIYVIWSDSDDYDGIRPEEVDVFVTKDGEEYETITLNSENEWKKTYTDSVTIPTYEVDGEGIQAYEKTVLGLTITYFHEANIPSPPPVPNLEERVEVLEQDMSNLNYVIGGMVE